MRWRARARRSRSTPRQHAASDGLFDITSGILRSAWDFRAKRRPAPGQLEALLPRIGWPQVQWKGGRIALPQPGMELDFGGFGKEYAADRAATLLQEHGVRHGLVNLGGDIRLARVPTVRPGCWACSTRGCRRRRCWPAWR
jgi:thiamine biosynthesis lipoprotein ApbE